MTAIEPSEAGVARTAPAAGDYRVAGIALGRFAMIDGRPQDEDWIAAVMVRNFMPGTVPLLSRHGGLAAGYLDTLRAEGPDLRWTAKISPWPDIVEQLRHGHGISIEYVMAYRLPSGQWPAWVTTTTRAVAFPYYLGKTGNGPTLTGVALSVRPAARGSVAWIVRGSDG